jgi:hypothetical protein
MCSSIFRCRRSSCALSRLPYLAAVMVGCGRERGRLHERRLPPLRAVSAPSGAGSRSRSRSRPSPAAAEPAIAPPIAPAAILRPGRPPCSGRRPGSSTPARAGSAARRDGRSRTPTPRRGRRPGSHARTRTSPTTPPVSFAAARLWSSSRAARRGYGLDAIWQPIVHQRSRMIGALPTKSRDAFETAADILVNRELSWLDLNARVLDLAADGEQPLLERAKFCAIFSSNLDDFFTVRVAAARSGPRRARRALARRADGR